MEGHANDSGPTDTVTHLKERSPETCEAILEEHADEGLYLGACEGFATIFFVLSSGSTESPPG